MSTIAPRIGVQRAPSTAATRRSSVSTAPGRAAPVAGSSRTSERSSRSSTKYGPSVCAGVSTQPAAPPVAPPAGSTAGQPPSSRPPAISRSASRRFADRSCWSSLIIVVPRCNTALVAATCCPHLQGTPPGAQCRPRRRVDGAPATGGAAYRPRDRMSRLSFVIIALHAYVGARLLCDLPGGALGVAVGVAVLAASAYLIPFGFSAR